MLPGNDFIQTVRLGRSPRSPLEVVREGDIVDKGPGIVELAVECPLQISHALQDARQLRVADEGEERRIGPAARASVRGAC